MCSSFGSIIMQFLRGKDLRASDILSDADGVQLPEASGGIPRPN